MFESKVCIGANEVRATKLGIIGANEVHAHGNCVREGRRSGH